jgi:endonuclease YncB( thermonuclease family)
VVVECSNVLPHFDVAPSYRVPHGPAKVIDGDTIVVAEQLVRLHGIDAPELD